MRTADNHLDDYRITSVVEIQDLLRRLLDARVMVTLSAPQGESYTTMLWTVDAARGVVCFSAEANDSRLQTLLDCDEVVAVAYLDSIKVQFDVDGLVQVRGGNTVLNARFPHQVYRFQRRSSFRVRPLLSNTPVAHFRHPSALDLDLSLRVLDISLGGVALALPLDLPMVEAGSRVRHCLLELDAGTHLDVTLTIHHVSVLNQNTPARLGCELKDLQGADERALQHYINQTQKRRHALAL